MYQYIIFAFFFLLAVATATAQEKTGRIAYDSPDGVYIMVSERGLSPSDPYHDKVGAVVSRRIGDGTMQEIGRVERAQSLKDFSSIAGDSVVAGLREMLSLTDDDALWNYIITHPDREGYGVFVINLRLGLAMGWIYLDRSARDIPDGSMLEYAVRYATTSGSMVEGSSGNVTKGESLQSTQASTTRTVERDSLLAVTWRAPIAGNEDVVYGRVYVQRGGYGDFSPLPIPIMPGRTADSLEFTFEEWTPEAEAMYAYYIVPTDFFGRAGRPSDTATLVSIDFRNISLIENARAEDSSLGVVLKWDPIPSAPWFVGVQVERSTNVEDGYAILDTLPIDQNQFIDITAKANVAYYYRLKGVTFRSFGDPPSAMVTGTHVNTLLPPPAPYGLTAAREGRNVRLSWESVDDSTIWAYLVYRGTNELDSMSVVSPPLTEMTFVDTSDILDGRTTYTYAVRAINMSELEGPLSATTSMQPDRVTIPAAPVGVSLYTDAGMIRLHWTDAALLDNAVEGYLVYRRPASDRPLPEHRTATEVASSLGFQRVVDTLITAAAFDDVSATEGTAYDYAVSTVDAFGMESPLSPFTTGSLGLDAPIAPSGMFARSTSRGVVLEWEETLQSNIDGYTIYRRTIDGQFTRVATLDASTTTWTDTKTSGSGLLVYAMTVTRKGIEGPRGPERSLRLSSAR